MDNIQNALPASILSPTGETNIRLSALASEEAATMEYLLQSLLILRQVELCTGTNLDSIGLILHTERWGRADEDYRRAMRLQLKIMHSKGSIAELEEICILLAGSYFIELRELHPGNTDSRTEEDFLWLDGSWFLSGDEFMSADVLKPAFFEVKVSSDTPDNLLAELKNAVKDAKAVGVSYRIVRAT